MFKFVKSIVNSLKFPSKREHPSFLDKKVKFVFCHLSNVIVYGNFFILKKCSVYKPSALAHQLMDYNFGFKSCYGKLKKV